MVLGERLTCTACLRYIAQQCTFRLIAAGIVYRPTVCREVIGLALLLTFAITAAGYRRKRRIVFRTRRES